MDNSIAMLIDELLAVVAILIIFISYHVYKDSIDGNRDNHKD